MSAAQRAKVVRDAIEIVPVWRHLCPRVVHGRRLPTNTRGQWRRHVVRQIKRLEREVYKGLDLLREVALDREPLEMDQQNRRQSCEGQQLRGFPERLAVGTVPVRAL